MRYCQALFILWQEGELDIFRVNPFIEILEADEFAAMVIRAVQSRMSATGRAMADNFLLAFGPAAETARLYGASG